MIQGKTAHETLDVIRRTVRYMDDNIYTNPTYDLSEEKLLAECTNRDDLCAYRAAIGGEHNIMWLFNPRWRIHPCSHPSFPQTPH